MSVWVLGCAGSSFDPELREPCSGYLVEYHNAALLLDCGYGTFDSYRTLSLKEDLCAIVISHAHRDHCGDLARFLQCVPAGHEAPVVVASAESLEAIGETLNEFECQVIVVKSASRVSLGPFVVELSATTHQIPTLAANVRAGGHSLVYSADTGPGWGVPREWRGADTAVVECTYLTRGATSWPYHLAVDDALDLAREINAERTLLTHVPPREDPHQRLELAREREPTLSFDLAERGGHYPVARGDDYR
jgi:ribonuclease BN (tRNA processing enzyme)